MTGEKGAQGTPAWAAALEADGRYHGLDAVRGWVLTLGVLFHAALSFLPGPQVWIVMDASRSVELSVMFYVLHIFRMTVFFVLAGFFARMLLEKRGVGGFIKNRLTRIGIPLASAWPIVLTAFIAVIVWVSIRANGGVPIENPEPPPPLTAETFPWLHLWFLYVLLIFYAVALLLRGLVALVDRGGAFRARVVDPIVRILAGPGAPVIMAIPVAALLFYTPNWFGWFGIETPDKGVIPQPTSLAIFFLAFGLGWLIHRQPKILRGWGERWAIYVGPAVGATIGCLMIAGLVPVFAPATRDPQTLGYAALYAFAIWAWTIAIIGFGVRFLSGESPARRYLADASYWIYIVHIPIVIALQAAFAPIEWPWFAKFPLLLAIAFAIMLASYQWFVRYSFIGAILNGKKEKPAKRQRGQPRLAVAE
jgi:glucan biosynthesis protein C